MNVLIEEAPPLIISICLIVASVVLLVLRVASVLEGMPVLILVAGYWIGNGSARLASQQTLTSPQPIILPPAATKISDAAIKMPPSLPTLPT